MSRQLKVIFAATCLALLGASCAYVYMTWTPANPLRFRLQVENTKLNGKDDPIPGRIAVEIVNTTDMPIFLQMASLHEERSSRLLGRMEPRSYYYLSRSTLDAERAIPPHGSALAFIELQGWDHSKTLGPAEVRYLSKGRTELRLEMYILTVRRHLPPSLQRMVSFAPNGTISITPLEVDAP